MKKIKIFIILLILNFCLFTNLYSQTNPILIINQFSANFSKQMNKKIETHELKKEVKNSDFYEKFIFINYQNDYKKINDNDKLFQNLLNDNVNNCKVSNKYYFFNCFNIKEKNPNIIFYQLNKKFIDLKNNEKEILNNNLNLTDKIYNYTYLKHYNIINNILYANINLINKYTFNHNNKAISAKKLVSNYTYIKNDILNNYLNLFNEEINLTKLYNNVNVYTIVFENKKSIHFVEKLYNNKNELPNAIGKIINFNNNNKCYLFINYLDKNFDLNKLKNYMYKYCNNILIYK